MIIGFLMTLIVGIFLCFFGYRNMQGDISSLHSYHRSRVKAEDVKPFGRLTGIGSLICGGSVIVMSLGNLISHLSGNEVFTLIGSGVVFVGLILGCVITFYAMIKYNGGIFR